MSLVEPLSCACMATLLVALAGCATPDRTSPTPSVADTESGSTPRVRRVRLEGQANFRDLGGYETGDGRIVKWGEVYRSGELSDLSDRDVAQLEQLGLRNVVNLLTQTELEQRGRDRIPGGAVEVSLPLDLARALGELNAVVLEARRTGDFSKVSAEINAEIQRILVRDAQAEYGDLLRRIADPENRPIVFLCSEGVHRTGAASALLLSALGVPWETVREDYLYSNMCRAEEVAVRLAELQQTAAERQGVALDEVDTADMEAYYLLQGAYIDAALSEAVREYGSMDNYLKEGLGLSAEELKSLRDGLLESAD